MRRAAKRNFFKPAHRDAAEPLIITAGRSVGATVVQLSGKDVPDLCVGFQGVTFLGEVKSRLVHEGKDGYTRKTTTRISKGQKDFAAEWKGAKVGLWYEPADMLKAIGAPYVQDEAFKVRWLAESGAFLCESCWLPEDGLHARDCPNRTRLKPKPGVQSAHRAAMKLEEAMPKTYQERLDAAGAVDLRDNLRLEHLGNGYIRAEPIDPTKRHGRPRGVEGELQPLKVKRVEHHQWGERDADEVRECNHCGVRTSRAFAVWQRRKGGHWRQTASELIPDCTGPTSTPPAS